MRPTDRAAQDRQVRLKRQLYAAIRQGIECVVTRHPCRTTVVRVLADTLAEQADLAATESHHNGS